MHFKAFSQEILHFPKHLCGYVLCVFTCIFIGVLQLFLQAFPIMFSHLFLKVFSQVFEGILKVYSGNFQASLNEFFAAILQVFSWQTFRAETRLKNKCDSNFFSFIFFAAININQFFNSCRFFVTPLFRERLVLYTINIL